MKSYNSMVKCYKRKKSNQYVITLKQGHPFKEDEEVIIIPKTEIKEFQTNNNNLEDTIKLRNDTIRDLNTEISKYKDQITALEEISKELDDYKEKYNDTQNKYNELLNNHDKLRNSKDHLQERFNKSQDEVIKLERELNSYRIAITKIQSLSFVERLLNKIPDEVKQLSGPEV